MSETVINVENLSKAYIIGHQSNKGDGLRHSIERALRSPAAWLRSRVHAGGTEKELFYALRDVNLEVTQGEVVGIIGRNGAGKSTLLKILSRITEPTSGQVRLRGRVASLLEVGTGFHPELTGRENIFLNGAVLGMTRLEIKKKFDEIVDFSGIEKFLDTPVKRYSSGMYVRLAFAVAAHLEPETLIVDEVLAVGDAAFQRKCLGKLRTVGQSGRTVLFVSHNLGAIRGLCQRVAWLDRGHLMTTGPSDDVIMEYLKSQAKTGAATDVRTSTDKISLYKVEATDDSGQPRLEFHNREDVHIAIDFEVHQRVNSVINPVIAVRDDVGNIIFTTTNFNEEQWYAQDTEPGVYRTTCTIPKETLNDRPYTIGVCFCERLREVLLEVEDAMRLEIVDSGQHRDLYTGTWHGLVRPTCKWTTSMARTPVHQA